MLRWKLHLLEEGVANEAVIDVFMPVDGNRGDRAGEE